MSCVIAIVGNYVTLGMMWGGSCGIDIILHFLSWLLCGKVNHPMIFFLTKYLSIVICISHVSLHLLSSFTVVCRWLNLTGRFHCQQGTPVINHYFILDYMVASEIASCNLLLRKVAWYIFCLYLVLFRNAVLIYMWFLLIQQHPFFQPLNWDDLLSLKIDPPFKPPIVSCGRYGWHHMISCTH